MPNIANSFNGFYRALVIDTKDPQLMGRVRVRIPDLMVDPDVDATGNYCDDGLWAHPANNYLGGRNLNDTSPIRCDFQDATHQGSCLIPPMGSHVFVFFEKGDPNHPFYFGAAEYGQYIVPPENRLGPDYDKKWTLLKTHEGRTIIVSDDKYDERVEITGKKRQLTDAPFGDIDSVFKIDDNQSVILIDERKDNEKIFIKDYRGNYIKMIQHENSEVHGKVIEDQLHVYFHDDIHIDTPKNIYITAGENIHIRAGNDIYIHALHDMFIKAKNDLKEMAHRINRYSETSDDRYAGTDINDKAANIINRQGVNEINDISVRCTRSALNMIADQSANKISYVSAATTNISSGGPIMIMGSKTITQTSCAPEPVVTKCRTAEMTPAAIPANPDKFRYETIIDNPVDFPKEYKPNLIPHQFYSDITKESQSYLAIVGGSPIDPYIPPTRLAGGEVNDDLADSINNDINDRIQKIKMAQAEEIDASVVKTKNGTVKIVQSSTGESTGEVIPVSIYPSSKTSSEIIEEAVQESYEQLRNKDVAEEKYKELIKKEYEDVHDEIKKTIDDIKDLVEESKEEYKFKFIDSSINTNYTIFNTLVSNWKEYCTYETISSNLKSTRYECDIIFEKWLFIIEYLQKIVENKWHSYLKDILPDEILAWISYIINSLLKSNLTSNMASGEYCSKDEVKDTILGYLNYIKNKDWSYTVYVTAENHTQQLLNDIVKNDNNFTDLYFTSNIINNWKIQCELFYINVNDKIQKEKLDVYYKNQLAIELRQAETGIKDLGVKYDLQNSAEAIIQTLKNKDVYDNLNSKFLEQYTEAKNIVTAEMAINSFYDIQNVFSETSNLIVDIDLYPDKYFNDSKITKCSNDTFEKFDKGITDAFLSKCPSIVNNPNFIKEYNDIWKNKEKLENPTDICNLVFKYVKQLFLDNHSNIMKECEPSCFSAEFDTYRKLYEIRYEEYICRDCIMKIYSHSADPIGYIQIIDGWEQKYALIYTSDLNSICQNIEKDIQDNLLNDVIGGEGSSSTVSDQSIKLIAEDINKKVPDEKINSDTKAISEQVQEESRIDPESNSPAAEETKQAAEEAGEQVTEEVCSSIKKADEYLKNMDQPAKAIENTVSQLKIPNVGEAASNVGSAIGNYLKSNKFVSDMLDKKDSLPFADPNDLFDAAAKYCGSGEDSQNEYMKDMFDSVNAPMKDLCGLFSTSGSFMDGIGGAFELPSDSLMNSTLSANMIEIPSLFGKGMGGSTDSMLGKCNDLISNMPPLSNVLCTSEELTNSLDGANNLVNSFKDNILNNLTEMISSPDKMAKQLADFLNKPFNIGGGSDSVNKLKGTASLSFLDKFKSMFDPILNVGDSISKLQDSLSGVFDSFEPFASFGDGFGELKDSIGNIFSDGMLDGFKKLWDISGQDDLKSIFDKIKDTSYDELMSDSGKKNEILSSCKSLCDAQKTICTTPQQLSSAVLEKDSSGDPSILDSMVAEVETEITNSGIYPTPESIEKEVSPLIEDVLQQAINSQKEIIESNIKLDYNQQDNKFSEFNPVKKLNSLPTSCSCGHEYLLFMKRKYINTILSWLGVNKVTHVSFSLVRDTDKLMSYKPQDRLMDAELIDQFNDMMNKYAKGEEPDKNNKWWNNLKFILDCCDIYGIDLIITIFDFNEVNAFITNRSETSDFSYTSANWDDNKQGRFLSDVCKFLKYRHDDNGNIIYDSDRPDRPERRYSKIILNLGYSNYINLSDKTNKLQPMYPSCGYIRPMVMHLAYQCHFSSNMMSITANEEGNVYYYNPYSEWKSYDDAVQHNLNEYEITARDYVDGCYNGNAQSVIYDTDGSAVVGGYCKFIIDCDRKSIPNMSIYDMSGRMNQPMYNLKTSQTVVEYYTDEAGDIDCNIIPKIFNPSALNTIKYLYDNNYFSDKNQYRFNQDGDLI